MPKKRKVDPITEVDGYMTSLIREMGARGPDGVLKADVNTRLRFANTLVKWLAVKAGIDDPDHGSGFGDDGDGEQG